MYALDMNYFSSMSIYFLFQETSRLAAEPVPGITAKPDDHNSRYFHVTIKGPNDVSKYTNYISMILCSPSQYRIFHCLENLNLMPSLQFVL